jgi:hypothetical protein
MLLSNTCPIPHEVEQAFMPLSNTCPVPHGVEQAFMPAVPAIKKIWALAPEVNAITVLPL